MDPVQDGNVGGLKSPPPTDTPNVWLCIEQFPLKEIQKLSDSYISDEQKSTHKEMGRKGQDTLTLNPTPGTATTQSGGNSQLPVSP